MKLCVFGAGATGAHFAALLARSGAGVSVIARGANLAAIRMNGIGVRTEEGIIRTLVDASDTPAELGVQEVVLVTVKAYALAGVAQTIGPLLGPHTAVVFLQNGIPWWYFHGHGGVQEGRRLPAIDPDDALWRAVGPERVIGGITSTACTLVEPGVVEVKGGLRALMLGEPDGSESERLGVVASAFRRAGFPVETTRGIRHAIWSKLALNLASGPMSVLAPASLEVLYAQPALVDARFRILAEVAAIADAMGVGLSIDFAQQMAFARSSPHIPSIAQDFLAGRQPEIDTMFLAPLDMARACGVATPILDLLIALVEVKAASIGAPSTKAPG